MDPIKTKFFEICKHIERYWNLEDRADNVTLNGYETIKIYSYKNNIAVFKMLNGNYMALKIFNDNERFSAAVL